MGKNINVIVSHPGKQYVNRLCKALQKKDYLFRFYTTLWYNPNNFLSNFKLYRKFVGKRRDDELTYALIRQNSLPEIIRFIQDKIFPKRKKWHIHYTDKSHDSFIAKKISNDDNVDIFIGYEMASFKSFQKAKDLGMVTVLDLAQVHYKTIEELRNNFSFFKASISDDQLFKTVCRLKQKELELVDYIFTLSNFSKQTLIDNGIPKAKIFTISLGFDPSTFIPKQSYTYMRSKKLKLLFASSITYRKGLHLIFEAIQKVGLDKVELTVVGPIGDAKDLLNNNKSLCTYYAYMEHAELKNKMQEADVFLMPSYLDSWSMAVIEAMACGTPVIVSENTGSKDAVEQGGGFIIPIDNAKALAQKIQHFIQYPEDLEVKGKKARMIAEQYTWEGYEKNIQKAVEKIILDREG